LRRVKAALPHARAKRADFAVPYARIHILGPKRPGPALRWPGFINRAAFAFEEATRPGEVDQMEMTIGFSAITPRERQSRDAEVASEAPPIRQGQIDEPVSLA
jgi:hypothetical protein